MSEPVIEPATVPPYPLHIAVCKLIVALAAAGKLERRWL